ncbi:hypothetical protein L1987_84975 [Smallanthus sonchifolius]|uniref:Uncharacterized protein n=1 Tax=Smallanthus sonchifolius TaxID=185202 RepID=A0ACB8XWF1_9ASTR|nr:hypothetical protein L1987_84975 [Smallanthus sonchifolius]
MGKTGEDADGASSLKMGSELKKGHNHREKKRKIESNKDQHDKDKSMEEQKVKGNRVRNKTIESVENNTEKSKVKSKSKKVSFSAHVEVFPTSDTQPEKQTTKGDGLVRGKRFTPEEDEIVKRAVLNYITANDLGDEGLKMVLNCKSHPGMKKCWQEIELCLPYRPCKTVNYRAHILFERGKTCPWTTEEIELLKELHEKHGQEEKRSKNGMLRDNIPWTAISEKLSTRNDAICCAKWYYQLTSSLVAEKKWCDSDDYRMIGALYEIDVACVEDVDWDNAQLPGDICLKRWNQMVKYIGDYGSKPFGEQVDILAKRYCPDLAETREVWDNKPVVP